ncbi:uncharacterized protein LOC129717479 [Wyeomyia smithii]|uniref:uncharacterized protein LOC129717479 n=1 Tax=Wyeomyia smithii TaxID=174621 RepID=UPI002467D555|nr:uncharacterized protein LOC129717479 [Wyeomyia smithii]
MDINVAMVDGLKTLADQMATNVGSRQINQVPELVTDKKFARLCAASCGSKEFTNSLQPILKRFFAFDRPRETNRSDSDVSFERGSILREIISLIISRLEEFRTLEQYMWLLKFACASSLLKNVPPGIAFETNRVIRAISSLNTEEFEFDPLKIHILARSLFEDIPLDGMNLIHVIKKLVVLNHKLLYYVSIALMFAGLRRYTANWDGGADPPPPQMYRLHNFETVLIQLQQVKIDDLRHKLNTRRFFLLLKLLSVYQNAVLLRHSTDSRRDVDEQHCCFAEFFRFPVEQRKAYLQWLRTARNVVSSRSNKSSPQEIADKEDFLLIIELIDLDMIPSIEDDIDDE